MPNRRDVVIMGPPAVGKGLSQKVLEEEFGSRMLTIGTGKMIRERMGSDPEFAHKHQARVAAGDLIDDKVIIGMAREKLYSDLTPETSLVYWDGVFRTVEQVDQLLKEGFVLPCRTHCVVLHATADVCRSNYEHRNKNQPDGPRIDMKSFSHRMNVYNKHKDSLLKRFGKAGVKIVHIDANRDLIKQVVPDVLAYAKSLHVNGGGSARSLLTTDPQSAMSLRQRLLNAGPQPWLRASTN
ncbi:MAG: nucleoside monophosphate kinase [bacterium]|nr:nucleoside monophosphate kinase [bacterium]